MGKEYIDLKSGEMFEQGCAFMKCGDYCNQGENEGVYIDLIMCAPQIVNYSFACEVFLKTLLLYYEIPFEKEHKLKELFEKFPDEKQQEIMNRTILHSGEWDSDFCYRGKNDKGYELLDQMSNAFVDWRYSYEHQKTKPVLHISLNFLIVFCAELREECCQSIFHTTWEEYERGMH